MGLLDDAIREHMELKRLRGADPGEVAREEHDALGPVVRERDPEESMLEAGEHIGHEDEDAHPDDHNSTDHVDSTTGYGAHGDRDPFAAPSGDLHSGRGPDFANVGQETAELDMRTVLGGQREDGSEEASETLGQTPGQEQLWLDQQQQAPQDFDFDP